MGSPAIGNPVILFAPDHRERREAIDPARSFMVQAPAGSGKTELLIQRFLRLLAEVERPEAIVAITFTRKAAGEMLERILATLRAARAEERPDRPHEQLSFELAAAVLARDAECHWDLLENPGRLRVQTIDSLCTSVVGQMPWLSRLGAMPRIEEKADYLYAEAARRTVLMVEQDTIHRGALETLLTHLDNDATRVQQMLAAMLATREQWLALAFQTDEEERGYLEEALGRALSDGLETADRLIPGAERATWLDLACYAASNMDDPRTLADQWPAATPDQYHAWRDLASIVLTKEGEWRKAINKTCGFPAENKARKQEATELIERLREVKGLEDALAFIRALPPQRYQEAQWKIIRSLLSCLKLAVSQLRLIFRERGTVDFGELGSAARTALGDARNPTDLAIDLESRIQHLLVDEFQDTSLSQFELVARLTNGWQPNDGRTLFLVGDPMQSIYRFRQAEVGLFVQARQQGIGQLRPEPLTLRANYRSGSGIVERVNQIFDQIFPGVDHVATGAITYSSSVAMEPGSEDPAVSIHAFRDGQELREAEAVVQIVKQAHRLHPENHSVAILVAARSHLAAIVPALQQAGLKFRAIEIDPLEERTAVRDLLALTRAMLHEGDRISWLAILRAPWCGLTLTDIHSLVAADLRQTIWQRLQNLDRLTDEGRQRAERLRQILRSAFAERGRWPLRRWVERAWIGLGGPACLPDENALRDAADYLELLEQQQTGSDLSDFDGFRKRVDTLFAQPDTDAEDWLQVMTIHQAKGLQFDTVILPGLGRPEKMDDTPLFLSHQWPRPDGTMERLLAPVKAAGANDDPAYQYLQEIEKRKGKHERVRRLYVASTRAKHYLHLLGHVNVPDKGAVKPEGRSMLSDLFPALTLQEQALFLERRTDAAPPSAESALAPEIVRSLPVGWIQPVLPAPVLWQGAAVTPAELLGHQPTFEWVGSALRHAGTVVHAFLQRMARGSARMPEAVQIRSALAHTGVSPADLDVTTRRVESALRKMVAGERGQWLLSNHAEARCEYAISGVLDGRVVRGTIDRTFIDDQGIRWIVDYKTSAHSGSGLGAFIDDQQRRYEDQLNRYARLLEPLGQPVRLGLYFPLLDEWREWGMQKQAAFW